MHSAFDLKFGNEHRPLSDQKLAKFREIYEYLKVIIIDEISLLGADTLFKIHLRLCEIFKNEELFGGISVILMGDYAQLPPVKVSQTVLLLFP